MTGRPTGMIPVAALLLLMAGCLPSSPESHASVSTSEPQPISGSVSDAQPADDSTTSLATAEVTATSVATPMPIHPAGILCSVEVSGFPCSALIDGSPETEWQAPERGIGAEITFTFDGFYQFTEIGFTNHPDSNHLRQNLRVKAVSVALDDLEQDTVLGPQDDNRVTQWFSLRSLRTSVITVTVVGAYPSLDEEQPPFGELALAEVEFRGIDARDVPPTSTEWRFTGTIIDDGQGPEMCAGDVIASLPPRCVGVPLDFFDWDGAQGYEQAGGVRWTQATLVGTLSDGLFRLTRPPASPRLPPEEPSTAIPLPCEEPDGGWQIINPATTNMGSAAVAYAQAQPEFLGNWDVPGINGSIKVFSFAGKLEEHEAALRDIYGGPICVHGVDRSLAELETIRVQVQEAIVSEEAAGVGIHLLDGQYRDAINIITGTVEFYVLAAEPESDTWLNRHFGEGVVELHSLLQRVEQP